MPEISRFFGIVIQMHTRDHGPPHFHAIYGSHEIDFYIRTGRVVGDFPSRALRLVREWANLHGDELIANWDAARQRLPLARIEPLE
ncbi:MAG: DUF4160 domain-containing protein [Deltaproteobacteria bacterium]|nr:DUF4160 domain-containing protein [Deltaproteobacteria bacterium]